MTTDIMTYWPFPYEPRPNQIKALKWLEQTNAKYMILEAPVGCHSKGTEVILFNGTLKRVEDICVGDVLMGPDSTPRHVIHLYTGRQMMYKITPTNGDSFVANLDHILSLKIPNTQSQITNELGSSGFTGNDRILNISIREYLTKSDEFKTSAKLYRPQLVNFKSDGTLPVHPYILGFLLGNGILCDEHIATCFNEVINRNTNTNLSGTSHYFTAGGSGKLGGSHVGSKSSLLEDLTEIGAYGTTSNTQFIPHRYKVSSEQDRLQLLAGLIDTIGDYTNGFRIRIKSDQLAADISFVARSLGYSVNLGKHTGSDKTYIEITFTGDLTKIPIRDKRKKAQVQFQQHTIATDASFIVEPVGIDDFYGFQLDGDHLYMLKDFTVTHNSGKSNIGITYSAYVGKRLQSHPGDSFILTPQKILQEQYENSFRNNEKVSLASLYGKSNYQCHTKNVNCEIGGLLKPGCQRCTYGIAKDLAKRSANTVMNYKLALLLFGYTNTFAKQKREVMILDECHTLENHLVDFDAVSISEMRCKKHNINWVVKKTTEHAIEWIKSTYLPKLNKDLENMQAECEPILDKSGIDITSADIKKLRELSKLTDHVDELTELTLKGIDYINENFVLTYDKTTMSFKRLTGAYSFKRIIDPSANRFLFMSSTILNKDGFCRDLGIDPDEADFLSLDSEFPIENRPVLYMPQMKMNAAWNSLENTKNRNIMISAIKTLLDLHKNDSGIIHTGNFQIAQWLVEQLEYQVPHVVYHHNPNSGNERGAAITNFMADPKPSILISPSITEGLDLKDDLGRFAIIAKVPFGNLGDQWIKKRMDLSIEWYQRRALIDIIQGGGRVVRGPEDRGNVYILDESWAYLYKQTFSKIPKWWREAYRVYA